MFYCLLVTTGFSSALMTNTANPTPEPLKKARIDEWMLGEMARIR